LSKTAIITGISGQDGAYLSQLLLNNEYNENNIDIINILNDIKYTISYYQFAYYIPLIIIYSII